MNTGPGSHSEPGRHKQPPDPRLQTALRLHQSGEFAQAESLYRRIVETRPTLVEAHYLLGTLLAQRGEYPDALPWLIRATQLEPRHAQALNNLGIAQHKLGETDLAMAQFRAALAVDPNYAEARNNLGDALREQGQLTEAAAEIRKSLEIDPGNPEAHNNLGLTLIQLGYPETAEASLRKAVALRPNYRLAWRNLGRLYQQTHKLSEAYASYQQALNLDPTDIVLQTEAGAVAQQSGNLDGARQHYRRALALDADNAEAHNNLGTVLLEDGELNTATRHYLEALRLKPAFPEAYNNLGNALMLQGYPREGVECYTQALTLRPGYTQAHSNLLLGLNYQANLSPLAVYAEHVKWGQQQGALRDTLPACPRRSAQDRRLRIGYVSPDFRTHSVAYFFLPILRAHDRARFEIFCYSDAARPDVVTEECKKLADQWREIRGLDDTAVAASICRDQIDILVDLCGHMQGNRLTLFARRAAPLQISYLGYPNTTGLDTMDWRLTDSWADPPGSEAFHSEKLLRLRHGFLCYAPPAHAPQPGPLPVEAMGHITFGSFNNLTKITPETLALWAEILLRAPGSRLLLKNKSLRDASVRARYTGLLEASGITADRLELTGWLPQGADHLSLYQRIDIALDTHPYNGTTTTCEALWMGVPVISLAGETHASRVGRSILTQLGMTDLIARNAAEYSAIALRLCADKQRLAEIRMHLRDRMRASTLCGPAAFTAELERACLEAREMRPA
jgi:predicted O-linked N-acetylglucosamine transferase (SPINDLY family)